MANSPITPSPSSDYVSFLNTIPTVNDYHYVPSFVAKDMDLKSLDQNQADFLKIYDKETEEAKQGFQKINESQDKILSLRADNVYQQQQIDKLKETYGFNELNDLSEEDFANPYKVKNIESAVVRTMSDKNMVGILRSQAYSDAFKKEIDTNICAGKDANSVLCQMAKQDINKYQGDVDGAFKGEHLNAANYTPMDWSKELKADMDEIPNESFMKIVDQDGYVDMQQWEHRSKELAQLRVAKRMEEPRFRNNLIAAGYDTPEKLDQLTKQLVASFTSNHLAKNEFKFRPIPRSSGGGGGTGSPLVPANTGVGYFGALEVAKNRINSLKANASSAGQAAALAAVANDGEYQANAAFLDSIDPSKSGEIGTQIFAIDMTDQIKGKEQADAFKLEGYKHGAKLGNPYHLSKINSGINQKNALEAISKGSVGSDGKFTSGYPDDSKISAVLNTLSKDLNEKKAIVEKWKAVIGSNNFGSVGAQMGSFKTLDGNNPFGFYGQFSKASPQSSPQPTIPPAGGSGKGKTTTSSILGIK